MDSSGIDAYIFNGSDPHGSEYPCSRWRSREWISGFTGSAGSVVVTADKAGLWTDFRYWIQAPSELSGSGIELFRDGEEGTPDIGEWIAGELPTGSVLGYDGRTVTAKTAGEWDEKMRQRGIRVNSSLDLAEPLWTGRPALPGAPVIELTYEETGESRSSKMQGLAEALKKEDADSWIGIALDSAAWLLNVRGGDVPYNPVVNGFLIFTGNRLTWFTDENRLPDSLKQALDKDGIATAAYDDFFSALEYIPGNAKILIDPESITRAVMDRLPQNVTLRIGPDPVLVMKACKNEVEISRINRAMEKDGAAMVRFMMRLEKAMDEGERLTELDAAAMLLEERSALPGFLEESFSPIPAFGAHGAICHYEAKPEGNSTLEPGPNLLLLDSGGQWEEGTTDITRTFALGKPSDQQIRDYTLTLKGHVALSVIRFPRGSRGYQLDALARSALWQEGINYGHGTGHGVGYRLNVHEGPHRISPAPVDVALLPGMVVSDEPGVYRENLYGIRIENLLLCREDITTEFGSFLAFDSLTLAPYDRSLIDTALLCENEIRWIDAYHSEVLKRLSPLLNEEETHWLQAACAPFNR
jgi:Xaa-Pro aminopeptidase